MKQPDTSAILVEPDRVPIIGGDVDTAFGKIVILWLLGSHIEIIKAQSSTYGLLYLVKGNFDILCLKRAEARAVESIDTPNPPHVGICIHQPFDEWK